MKKINIVTHMKTIDEYTIDPGRSNNMAKREDVAKYLIVSINQDNEHEIIFVTKDRDELIKRWSAFSGEGAIYELKSGCIQIGDYR